MRASALSGFLAVVCFAGPVLGATYYVAPPPTGSDSNSGLSGAPWATLQHAANAVGAGDTVEVAAGTYVGFYLDTSGTSTNPITFHAASGVLIDTDNATTADGINLEGASYVVIDGFTVRGATRAGIRAVTCNHVTIQHNVTDQNGRWGIFTGFADDLTVLDNECSRSGAEHGVYVSNSGDRPVIRGNRIHDNNANGIHMNGDASQGGDGIISNALVEQNVIYGNGAAGGSGINCDGVQDSVIQNNLLYDNHASGISLYMIDGAEGAKRNKVVNNTIVVASDGRWALNIQDGSTNNEVRNNVLFNRNTGRGSIDISADSFPLTSDYNLVPDRFSNDGTFVTLAAWQTATGQDAHSAVATEAAVFQDPGADDYRLLAGGPAVDTGTSSNAPSSDLLGLGRPQGSAFDIGAYELPVGGNDAGSGGSPGTGGATGTTGGASGTTGGVTGSDGSVGSGGTSVSDGSIPGDGSVGSGGGPGSGGASGSTGGGASVAGSTGNGSGGAVSGTGGASGDDAGDGAHSGDSGGCGCRTAPSSSSSNVLAALSALLVAFGRRRKTRR